MKGIIDRIEGEYAVVELDNGEIKDIHKKLLPEDAKEGMVIKIDHIIEIDYDETNSRKGYISILTESLWNE